MDMKKIIFLIVFSVTSAIAQNPAPAVSQSESILIMNGTAHLGNGEVIANSVIGIENGKIVLVADATRIRLDKSKYKKIVDANGKHVYPGLIDCSSTLGITEIDLVRATRDYYEVGQMNPNVRSIIAYNTDSKIQPTVRSNGVLLAQVAPQGGTISGTSSVVELDGWNWEDAAYKLDDGIHMNWPQMYIYKSTPENEEIQKTRMQKGLDEIENFFREAKEYSGQNGPAEKNVRFEAMRGLFDGSKKLYVHCDYVKEIVAAVDLSKRYNIKMVLVSGADSYKVADLLKQNNVSVIIVRTHSLPPREDEDVDLPYKLPFLLKQAGLVVAISMDGSWQARNVAFNAGTAAAYGLTKEEALMTITLNAARILGIDSTAGSLEEGKDGTLIISSGDVLDMRTNNIEYALIRGKEINLDNIQKQLYRKYVTKYGLK
jgi:imidazolonepropionase-like amidohydrolase